MIKWALMVCMDGACEGWEEESNTGKGRGEKEKLIRDLEFSSEGANIGVITWDKAPQFLTDVTSGT